MAEEKFISVWDYLIDNNELDVSDLILMAKIISLDKTKDGCYMSNNYICTLLRLKQETNASRRVSKLKNLGYIKVLELTKNDKSTRKIIPTYDNGLSLKISRVASKDKGVLLLKTTPLASKDNPPLSQETYYNISILDKLRISEEHISTIISEDKFETNEERGKAYIEREKILKQIKQLKKIKTT